MAFTTIDDPSKHFQTHLWTGDGNDDRNITFDGNSDMQPDMVWTKRRPTASSHGIRDSSRGAAVNYFQVLVMMNYQFQTDFKHLKVMDFK